MLIGVGVVIRRPDGTVLLGRRVYASEEPSWCLPGGKVDSGESFEAAVIRETFEECGIRLDSNLKPLGLLLDTFRDAPRVTAAYGCDTAANTEAETREPEKIREWRWFAPGDLPTPIFDASRKVLDLFAGRRVPDATIYRLARVAP